MRRSVIDDRFTARIQIALENQTDSCRTLTYLAETCDANLITGHYLGDEDITLELYPARWSFRRADDCWYLHPDEAQNLSCGVPVTTHTVSLSSGETLTWYFDLWESYKSGLYRSCMPPGDYVFSREFGSETGGDDLRASTLEGTTATLEFTLRLEASE